MAIVLTELHEKVNTLEIELKAFDIKLLSKRVAILESITGLPIGGQKPNRTVAARIKMLESWCEGNDEHRELLARLDGGILASVEEAAKRAAQDYGEWH